MRSPLWIILTFFTIGQAFGQYTSSPVGTFSVDQVKACAPFTITLSAPTCDGSVGCDVDFGNGVFGSVISSKTFTYTTAGTYTIRLVRGAQIDVLQVQIFQNTPPAFQVVNCGGNTVSLSITDSNYDQYVVNYGDATGDVILAGGGTNRHTYATPGVKSISVRGRKTGGFDNCATAAQNVTVVNALPVPTINQLRVLDNNSIRIQYDGVPNVLYRLEIATNNGTSFTQIKSYFNQTVDTIKSLQTDVNFYCFRVRAFNPCANTTVNSGVVCTADVDLAVENNQNVVTWRTSGTPTSQQVRRITPSNSSSITTVSTSPHTDTDIVCGVEYCYTVFVNYSATSQSISLPRCGVAISTDVPDAVANIATEVLASGVKLTWLADPDFVADTFNIIRVRNGSPARIGQTAALTFTDDQYSPADPSCYQISYIDACENLSELSVEVCPVNVTAAVDNDNIITLSWNAYNGYGNGVSGYIVEKYDLDGRLLQSISVGDVTTYIDDSKDLANQVYQYVVKARAADAGVPESISNRVTVTKNPNLFYPTSFTPNGDALNDLFNVYGQYISSFELDIFNRWGELMFTTTDLEQGWDGTFQGNPMPEGTYTFVATIEDLAGRNVKRHGSILLLRRR